MKQSELMEILDKEISDTTISVEKVGRISVADILDIKPETKEYDGQLKTKFYISLKGNDKKIRCPYIIIKQIKALMKVEKLISFKVNAEGEGIQKRYTLLPEVEP